MTGPGAPRGLAPDVPPVSVVVVSRGRPALLPRALMSLWQQDHPALEAVVVADGAGLAAVESLPFADRLKRVRCEEANISAARNLGIAEAAGTVVAFIDDDAAAEPGWARRLAEPFADARVGAACGFVRGRNGVSWQWRAATVDRCGRERALDVPETAPSLHAPPPDGAVKTVGTCAAFRRTVLAAAGGFDGRYRYFLDETDLNLRLARAGVTTAVVPGAVVHHGFAASDSRRADRAPRDLTEIGASVAVFLGAHCPPAERAASASRFREEQRRRALRHMVAGGLEPRDVGRLLRGFDRGLAEGRARPPVAPPPLDAPPRFRILRCGGPPGGTARLSAWRARARAARRQAADLARAGDRVVTLTLFSTIPARPRVRYVLPGFWERNGGLFVNLERDGEAVPWASFRRSVHEEGLGMAGTRQPDL